MTYDGKNFTARKEAAESQFFITLLEVLKSKMIVKEERRQS